MTESFMTYAKLTTGIMAICVILDGVTSDEQKDDVKFRFLQVIIHLDKSDRQSVVRQTAGSLAHTLDIIYGPRLSSFRAFKVSSLISFAFVLLIGMCFSSNIVKHYEGSGYKLTVLNTVFFAALVCVFPDFLSSMKARKILRLSQTMQSPTTVVWLILDFMASLFLCAVSVWVAIAVAEILGTGQGLPGASITTWLEQLAKAALLYVSSSISSLLFHPELQSNVPYVGIAFLSTLSTLVLFITNLLLKTVLQFIVKNARFRKLVEIAVDNLIRKTGLFVFLGGAACGTIGLFKAIFSFVAVLLQ